jgi:hypothetical protein
LSSFWFILKQQWTIEEINIFSNSSHLEWTAGLSDIILKGTHLRTIPARFGVIWFSGFRGEDLNVIFYYITMALNYGIPIFQKLTTDFFITVIKMAAVTKNINFFNCPLLL